MRSNFRFPYWYVLLSPFLLFYLGWLCNALAIAVNGGQMPVLWPGQCVNDVMIAHGDWIHKCMTAKTHLKILCDWMVSQEGQSSIGDIFLTVSQTISRWAAPAWALLIVRDYNR